jgi:hypothetical protein
MAITKKLLAVIGRRLPAIYDVIPRGQLGAVALNPQPLPPPHELGAALASEFIHTAWLAQRFGQNVNSVADDLGDWCPTFPKKPKIPWCWPIPDPEPHPDWHTDFQVGFAARLAVLSDQLRGTKLEDIGNAGLDHAMKQLDAAK